MMSGMKDRQNCSASARALVNPSAYLKRTNESLTKFQRPYRRSVVTASSADSSSPEMVVVSGTRNAVPISDSSTRLRGCRHRTGSPDHQSARLDADAEYTPVLDDLAVHLPGGAPVGLDPH